jgi:hypothetical protein
MNGLAGNKAARLFTSTERGQCKFMYSQRKVFWSLVANLVNRGMAPDQVIDSIHAAYGPKPPPHIINKLREDKKNNNLPFQLR